MNPWIKDNSNPVALAARQQALLAFCEEMHKHYPGEGLRGQCVEDPLFARRLFAKLGGFYLEGEEIEGQPPRDPNHPIPEMPKGTKFQVFEKGDTAAMDEYVLLTLPEALPDQPLPSIKPQKVWTCTWIPYSVSDLISLQGGADEAGSKE